MAPASWIFLATSISSTWCMGRYVHNWAVAGRGTDWLDSASGTVDYTVAGCLGTDRRFVAGERWQHAIGTLRQPTVGSRQMSDGLNVLQTCLRTLIAGLGADLQGGKS